MLRFAQHDTLGERRQDTGPPRLGLNGNGCVVEGISYETHIDWFVGLYHRPLCG